jgi:hypothetical protein
MMYSAFEPSFARPKIPHVIQKISRLDDYSFRCILQVLPVVISSEEILARLDVNYDPKHRKHVDSVASSSFVNITTLFNVFEITE